MYLNFFGLISILRFVKINGSLNQNNFKVFYNKDINLNAPNSIDYLILNANKPSKVVCLFSCHLSSSCFTAVFRNEKGLVKNCLLYNRYFDANELMESSYSVVYEKKNTILSIKFFLLHI